MMFTDMSGLSGDWSSVGPIEGDVCAEEGESDDVVTLVMVPFCAGDRGCCWSCSRRSVPM